MNVPQNRILDPMECYEGLSVPGKDKSPFQKLACRILAICANSASVERLFSLFGHILTKLRSRLRTEAMVQLAELKLHVRDEYFQNAPAKQRLKRHIAGAPRSTAPAVSVSSAATIPTTPLLPLPPLPPLPHSTQTPLTRDGDEHEDSASSAGPADGSLQAIADRLISMANNHDHNRNMDLDDEVESSPPTQLFNLSDLFDFSSEHWVRSSEAAGNRGLQDELDLYELIDLDASGELDTDVDVDGMAEAVLTSQ